MLVIMKHEVICAENKQLGKLVNVYFMLFIENQIRKQERNKRKKSLPCLPVFVRLLLKVEICSTVTAIICRPDSLCFSRCTPSIFTVLHGYFCLGKTSGLTTKAAVSEVLLQVVLCKVRRRCISQENWVGHEQIS